MKAMSHLKSPSVIYNDISSHSSNTQKQRLFLYKYITGFIVTPCSTVKSQFSLFSPDFPLENLPNGKSGIKKYL